MVSSEQNCYFHVYCVFTRQYDVKIPELKARMRVKSTRDCALLGYAGHKTTPTTAWTVYEGSEAFTHMLLYGQF